MSLADLGRTYHGGAPGPEPGAPLRPLLPLGRDLPREEGAGLVDRADGLPVGVGDVDGQAPVIVLHQPPDLAGVEGKQAEQGREDRHRSSELDR